MPTEFLHGLYDGGIGAGMWEYWELIRTSKVGGGGFFWALVDECVNRTDQNGKLDCAGNRGPDGIVGPHREKEGSFYTVREIWSPVHVVEKDFDGELTLENRYDFTNLRDCSFEWQLARFPHPQQRKSSHLAITSAKMRGPDIAPHASGMLKLRLPPRWRDAEVVYLTAKDPTGRELWTWSWELSRSTPTVSSSKQRNLHATETDETLRVDNGAVTVVFSKREGRLVEVSRNTQQLPIGPGPYFVAYRRNDRKYDDLSGESKLKRFTTRQDGSDLIVEAEYEGALKRLQWRLSVSGLLSLHAQLEYGSRFDGVVDMLGVEFKPTERPIDRIRWLGRGPYRVWQNRMQGTRLDVWENAYNDSTPGESWVYPEFKGYFSDWRWATLESKVGSLTIATASSGSFLGLFKPKDGVNG